MSILQNIVDEQTVSVQYRFSYIMLLYNLNTELIQ